ncbi:MAG: hypothetical protein KDD19_26440 [Phaeodactylibacter sp.]|nr:hypothetical protein [Phaeodactylibacter sp.]MCB9051311.1 glycosyl hydrolase family 38 [Lewinellaceae bacterium]
MSLRPIRLTFAVLFVLSTLPVTGQPMQPLADLWPVRSGKFTQGFATPLAGERLDFLPNLKDGAIALFLQAPGKEKGIEFETDPMPAGTGERHTFLWEAGLAKTTGNRPMSFSLEVNGILLFDFETAPDTTGRHWISKGEQGAELAFVTSFIDPEKGDLFGYMFLTVPRARFAGGEPLKIRITAQENSGQGWYLAFQNRVQASSTAYAMPALVRDGEALRQPVNIEYVHLGPPATAAILMDGKQQMTSTFHPGTNKLTFLVDQVETPAGAAVEIRLPETTTTHDIRLKPVRHFEVFLLPHSHVDIGFTHKQAEVEQMQWRNFEQGIELARKTADYPEGARYKWNVEVLWAVEGYLRNATPEKREAFLEAVRKGWIGLDALYGSELTGLQRPEELMHSVGFANRLAAQQNIPIESAMITDVPGYAWGIVPALAQNGVRYFSIGPNHMPHLAHGGYQVGFTFEAWGDIPFYWESPSGKEKVLFWMTRHGYSWFHDWLLGKLRKSGGTPILKFLDELDEEGYPFDLVQLRYTLADNGGPDTDMPDFVREWNEQYAFPQLRIATTIEMFKEFEQRYGDELPSFRGDFTPYWEDGAASSAVETAANRNAAEQLVQAEALWAMLDPEKYPTAAFDEAWTNVVLFSEHTWGSITSKTDPDGELARSQWEVKQGFAMNASRQAQALTAEAATASLGITARPVDAFMAFNTTSWPRTELVKLPAEWKVRGRYIVGADGKEVPSQVLSDGRLAFIAKDVPPFGALCYRLKEGAPKKTKKGVKLKGHQLSNEYLTASIDETSGGLASIVYNGKNLVDSKNTYGFNEYWYTGLNAANPQKSSAPKIRVKENGPLVASLLIESEAPGAHGLQREVELVAGQEHIRITNTVDKIKVLEDENARFSFPFNIPEGQARIDLAWAVMRPGLDQLKGANKNFFCPQRWVDFSNTEGGITWANPDAPLVEIGGMHGQNWMSDMKARPWFESYRPSTLLFSWVMNNAWFVNYKGYQEGPATFRYVLRPHQGFDSSAAKKFGIEQSQPLIPIPVQEGQENIPSLFTLNGSSPVIVSSLKPARDGNGLVIRLFNTTEEEADVRLNWGDKKTRPMYRSNPKEAIMERLGPEIKMGGWEILTVRVTESDKP